MLHFTDRTLAAGCRHLYRRAMHHRLFLLILALVLLAAPASANAYDTGPHSDITRDALIAEGFGPTAQDVAVVGNWFVDLYSNASKVPQSGHASTKIEVVGSLFGPRENWPQAVLDAVNRLHFDASLWDIYDVSRAELEWNRLQRATSELLRSIDTAGAVNKEMQVLLTIGMSLHALQDFYSHSTWIEQQGVFGVEGPDWNQYRFGSNPTWFDVPKSTRDNLKVYIGASTGHESRPHGAWNTDGNDPGNAHMEKSVNKDWSGRFGYDNSYIASYFATRQWVRAMKASLNDDALWNSAMRYSNRRGGALDHDLKKGALKIGMMTGHWAGQGEPCDPSISTISCGSRNGLGGDLIGARNATRDFFEDRSKSAFRSTFEALAPILAQTEPNGDLLPVQSARDMQASTRFVRVKITQMKGVGLRALGDPTPADRADNFGRAHIAGQEIQSGEINGRDSFTFGHPYSPFEFLKAIPNGAVYGEPVREMTVEIRTSSSAFSGTDDDVYLRISPSRRFALDKRLYNDFERGDRDTYSVPIDDAVLKGLTVGDVTRVQIEKSSDGVGGGWKLRGVKLVINGRTAYSKDHIDKWLEKNRRTWRASDFKATSPVGGAVPVLIDLYDEDSFVYGGNDHGDLNKFDRRKRVVVAYDLNAPVNTFALGGSKYSGRLGDGDKARINYTIDTLTPTPAANPDPVVQDPDPKPKPKPDNPPPPQPKPDLVITELGYNDASQYHFVVKNQGNAAAGAFSVQVTGETTYSFPSGLAAGASATRTFRTQCRVYTWEAIADSLSQVPESDENNNRRSYTNDACIT